MKKEIFSDFLKNSIAEKQQLLLTNGLTDEDKAVISTGIDNLTAVLEKLDNIEDTDANNEAIEELKTKVNELNETVVAIMEKIQQESSEETKQKDLEMENNEYLKSTNALHDFAEVLRNTTDIKRFSENWGAMLTQNGVSFESGSEAAYLPELVKGKIQDGWEKYFPWLAKLNKTGAKQYAIRFNVSNQKDETSRAKSHKKGDTKVEESITLDAKTVIAKALYKLMVVDNETVFNDDNSLVTYVLDESLRQWFYEVALAITVGDGRTAPSSGNPDLRVTSIESIDRATTDEFVTVKTYDASAFMIENIVGMRESIKIDGANDVVLLMGLQDLNALRKVQASSTSTPVYMSNADIAEMVGVSEIYPTELLADTSTKAIMFSPSKYAIVGEDNPRLAEWEDLKKNQRVYRYENFIGGAVEGLKSACVLHV